MSQESVLKLINSSNKKWTVKEVSQKLKISGTSARANLLRLTSQKEIIKKQRGDSPVLRNQYFYERRLKWKI